MKFIRKMTSIIAAGTILSVSAAASAESPASGDAAGSGVWTDIAGETSTSYDNLFDVILDEKYSDIWYQYCAAVRSEEHTSELQSPTNLVCRLLLEKNFFNDTATTEIYTLSLHDALPISFTSLTATFSKGVPLE